MEREVGAWERARKKKQRKGKLFKKKVKKKSNSSHSVVSATTKLGPLKSHFSWKTRADQPSTDAV